MDSELTPFIDRPGEDDHTSMDSRVSPPTEVDHFHLFPYHRTTNLHMLRKAQRRAGQGAATAGGC